MSRKMHNCRHCDHLVRTSPEQIFLLCTFWSAKQYPIEGVGQEFGYDYAITHCHMQPEAPACPFFKLRIGEVGSCQSSAQAPLVA